MPPNTVNVARPNRWGNPYYVAKFPEEGNPHDEYHCVTREEAVRNFREELYGNPLTLALVRTELRGKNLACWCPLDQPCHADVLLEAANMISLRGSSMAERRSHNPQVAGSNPAPVTSVVQELKITVFLHEQTVTGGTRISQIVFDGTHPERVLQKFHELITRNEHLRRIWERLQS